MLNAAYQMAWSVCSVMAMLLCLASPHRLDASLSAVGIRHDDSMGGAIQLIAFYSSLADDAIILHWETVSESDGYSFHICRSETASYTGEMLFNAAITGKPPGAIYHYEDYDALPGVMYYYWVVIVDPAGSHTPHGPIMADLPISIGIPPPLDPPVLRTFVPLVHAPHR